jgi:GTP-binding protein HflX
VTRLKRAIDELRRRRASQRGARHDRAVPLVTMAGYTNAGKSTLFNALCGAKAVTRNQMFSTLDPLTRRLRLPDGGTLLLSDTVGFITDMPEDLRVAFRATLEEITDSDLILHVVDASHPDSDERMRTVLAELESMGPPGAPVLTVYNKADMLGNRRPGVEMEAAGRQPSVVISALDGDGIERLVALMGEALRSGYWSRRSWPSPSPRLVAAARSLGVPVTVRQGSDGSVAEMEAWLTDGQAGRLDAIARGEDR